jgi:photosystem II stability/assembly factor-like uncharacterized protein
MRSIIILLGFLLIVANAELYGQARWTHKDSLWRDPGAPAGFKIMRDGGQTALWDEETQVYQTFLSKYLLNYSPAQGTQLVELPLKKSGYSDAMLYRSSYGFVFTYWDGFNNNAHRIYVKRRDSATWTEAFPGEMPGHVPYSTVVHDTSIIISNDKNGTFFSHSTDFGDTWHPIDMGFVGDSSPTRGYRDKFNVSNSVVACWRNDGYREFDLTNAKQSHPTLPKHTGIYARCGTRVLGSTVHIDDAHPSRLFTSADSGATWSYIDTVTVAVDGSKITPGLHDGRSFECTHIHRHGDSTFVLTTAGQHVIMTTNAGQTWRARSGNEPLSFTNWGSTNECYWFDLSDTMMLAVYRSTLYIINITQCTVRQMLLPLADVRSVTMLPNGELIAPANPSVYSSLDTGRTWSILPWPKGATWNESLSRSANISHAFVNSIHAYRSDSADVYSVDLGQMVRLYPGRDLRVRLLSSGLLMGKLDNISSDATGSIWTRYLNIGQSFTKLGGDSLLFVSPTVLLQTADHQDSLITPKGKGRDAVWATILSPTDWWLQSDSLYRSSDNGQTWRSAERGLPRYSFGDIIPMSSMKRLHDGTLLAGIRGLRKATLSDTSSADTALVREGGIWRSTDDGEHWQKSDDGLESDRYVWWIEPLSSGTILAVAGNMLFDAKNISQELTGWNLGGARIFRSDDNGLTWKVVYAETRDRDGYPGRRPILRTSTGRILAATMENGVIESGDDGRTWHEVGEDLYGRLINDIDEDSTGTIWVATDNGIWSWQPTTPVDEPYVNGKYTSVWAYPTPARNEVIIRLNNLNLLTTDAPHLTLYDITGVRRADLSDHVLANRSSERVEFSFSTTSLERGVYLLVLDTGRGFETMKISIWK